jgi:hypothetical protein
VFPDKFFETVGKDTFTGFPEELRKTSLIVNTLELLWPAFVRYTWKDVGESSARTKIILRSTCVLELATSILARHCSIVKNGIVYERMSSPDTRDVASVFVDAFAVCATVLNPKDVDTFGFCQAMSMIGHDIANPSAMSSRCREFLSAIDFKVHVPTACGVIEYASNVLKIDKLVNGRLLEDYGLCAIHKHLVYDGNDMNLVVSQRILAFALDKKLNDDSAMFANRMRTIACSILNAAIV